MNIRDNDFNKFSSPEHKFDDTTKFQAKIKTDNSGKETIVFKNKEAMKSGEQFVEIMTMIGKTLSSLFSELAFKEFRKDWKTAVSGEHTKIVRIEVPKGVDSSKFKKEGLLSLNEVKNIASTMEVLKKVKNNEEIIEFDPNLLNKMTNEETPGYELVFESENLQETYQEIKRGPGKESIEETKPYKKLHCYLVKSFDDLTTFNEAGARNSIQKQEYKKMPLIEAFDESKSLVVKRVPLVFLTKVTNSSEVSVASETMRCTQNDVNFELDFAVAMRKGTAELSTPKAMGEDAFVIDHVVVSFKGKSYDIPIMATLDGGGGHTLAQHGRENIKSTFEKHLNELITKQDKLDASVICRAMKKTDDELFGRLDAAGKPIFSGTGYTKLKENHNDVKNEFGISAKDFKKTFQNLRDSSGDLHSLNPIEIHEILEKNKNMPSILQTKISPSIEINEIIYNLGEPYTARYLQGYYEKSMGTEAAIEVQMVMNAFFVNENKQLECVTYNRGDSMALHVGSDETTPLSKPVSSTKINRSKTELGDGSRVISLCDGVHEVISINELQEANNSDFLKETSSEDYVKCLMQASVHTGSGDDKTIISAQVKKIM